MTWQASSGIAVARQRARMLEQARHFFRSRDVLEVETPALGQYTTTDPNVDSLRVSGLSAVRPFLQTSPESFLKRLLADGYPDIYSLGRVFRDGEAGRLHQPEFTMAEWYRHGFGLGEIIDDTVAFIATLLDRPGLWEAERLEYAEAFRLHANLDPFTASIDDIAAAANADDQLRDSLGDDRDAWLDLLLGTRVAAGFAGDRLTVLRHFPASQGAQARTCPADGSLADRFEVFFGAMELANGFVELLDPDEQRQRMLGDLDKRRAVDKQPVPLDEPLLAALESGLPPCAGVAVGFDRLVMIATGADDIRDVVTFAFDNATA